MRAAAREARDDLNRRLMPTTRAMMARHHDADVTMTELAKGLMRQTTWDRPMLASVLVAALVRIAELEARDVR